MNRYQTDGYAITMFAHPFNNTDLADWLGVSPSFTARAVRISTMHERIGVAFTDNSEIAMLMWFRYEGH